MAEKALAIFDIGKTNKKLVLFNQQYEVIWQQSIQLPETIDEDGEPCEDLPGLIQWIKNSFGSVMADKRYAIEGINFSTYGASLVHVNELGIPIAPLYNYLKKYPDNLQEDFYNRFGGKKAFCLSTASPALGHLNSGLQLLWLKHQKPDVFNQIKTSLHLPQFIAALFHNQHYSDITSIGCHTALWNFTQQQYHEWILKEGIQPLLAPLKKSFDQIRIHIDGKPLYCGIGLHDSSASLIPYQLSVQEPFVLVSTGTWSICMNPFTNTHLSIEELDQDCLCYLSFKGTPIKASRLFMGYQHEKEVKIISENFHTNADFFNSLNYDPYRHATVSVIDTDGKKNFSEFQNAIDAYYSLVAKLVKLQVQAIHLVQEKNIKKIFVDGGFSQNSIFMNMLAQALPANEIYATIEPQASALGAALSMHHHWNEQQPLKQLMITRYANQKSYEIIL